MTEANQSSPVPTRNQPQNAMASQSPERDNGSSNGMDAFSKSPSKANGDSLEKNSRKRRKVNHACVYCRRSHMTCDLERPCTRCLKRNIGHLCHDEPREPTKKLKTEEEGKSAAGDSPLLQERQNEDFSDSNLDQRSGTFAASGLVDAPQDKQDKPVVGVQNELASEGQQLPGYNNWNAGFQNQFQNMHSLHPNFTFNSSEASNEYNLLNDFLSNSMLDDGAFYPSDDPQSLFSDPSLPNTMGSISSNRQLLTTDPPTALQTTPQSSSANMISRPPSRAPLDKAKEVYYMTAADPEGTDTPEERMNKLLKAKYDAGLLKPFNYVQGYARLNTYMERHLNPTSKQRIARQLDKFRPAFRERMQKLTDLELVMVEMWFERSLMEYDRVFASMAMPACCWRRTGEIFRGNREMAELIHVPVEQLREGKIAIHEIIVEDSLVSYWEKFGAIAFDPSQKAILTSCSLKSPKPNSKDPELRCCFSFTIKRDPHHIPSLIIGHFLPILPAKPEF